MKTETFESKLNLFQYHYDTRQVFNDFLTLTLCAFSRNPITGLSYDEELYLETIAPYKESKLRFEFPQMLACLTNEMTERLESETGWDILGEVYERSCASKGKGQFFTPWHICKFMAQSSFESTLEERKSEPLRILEPSCGSGRMLLAMKQIAGTHHHYYAIDIDQTCVKMTALNLFLSGMFRSEIMCGNFLLPDDFRVSYKTSFLPFGIFRNVNKEQSMLWHMLMHPPKSGKEKVEPPDFSETKTPEGSQLTIF